MASAQTWSPEAYARHARFVSDLGQPVLELLAPRPAERILDLGCGDGVLTRKLAELGCDVIGVDASPEQVAAARALGIDARVVDGEALAFGPELDAVFSNAALHWMRDADAVIAGVGRALRPVLGWLETFAACFTRVLPPAERADYLAEVRARIQPQLCDGDGRWSADYVRLRFAATRSAATAESRSPPPPARAGSPRDGG